MTNESVVDKWISRSIENYEKSDLRLKMHCIWASPVVGKYDLGGTQQIADGIQRSQSTVRKHAHAHWMVKELRKNGNRTRVRTLWHDLPASFWWRAWERIHVHGYDAFAYLNNASLNKWSVRDMISEFERDLEAGSAPLRVEHAKRTFRALAIELINRYSASFSEAERIAALAVVDAFED